MQYLFSPEECKIAKQKDDVAGHSGITRSGLNCKRGCTWGCRVSCYKAWCKGSCAIICTAQCRRRVAW